MGCCGPPTSQGCKTFLRNHAAGIVSLDLFVVRTLSFKLLYGLAIFGHLRRRLIRVSVTTNPTAEWIAGQVTEAFPRDEAPRHLLRDRDGSFGPAYTRRIRAMGIRDHPTALRSPWQNVHVERLIGSIRRECLDHRWCSGGRLAPTSLKLTLRNTIGSGLTYRWTKTLQFPEAAKRSAISCSSRSWAGCIMNMSGFGYSVSTRPFEKPRGFTTGVYHSVATAGVCLCPRLAFLLLRT
jgi:transposase InsO family protein